MLRFIFKKPPIHDWSSPTYTMQMLRCPLPQFLGLPILHAVPLKDSNHLHSKAHIVSSDITHQSPLQQTILPTDFGKLPHPFIVPNSNFPSPRPYPSLHFTQHQTRTLDPPAYIYLYESYLHCHQQEPRN